MNLLCDIHRSADIIRVALTSGHISAILTTLTTPEGVTLTTSEGVILIAISVVEYRGDIIEDIEVSRTIPDLFYGVQQTDSITIRLANDDNGVDDTWDEIAAEEELRGCWVVLSRDDFTFLCSGKITEYTLGLESSITIEPRDDEVFEALLPAGIVTTDLFTTTALNIGSPIPINFGHCKNIPCPNIQNNLTDDHYDYLIGIGTHQSLWIDHANGRGIKREGVLVAESEYTFYDGSQGSPYPGYSFIRFIVEQKGFNNEYLNISADVYGLELGGATANRNFATIIKNIISDTTWGLGESINVASFTTAAASLPTDSWMCDISLNEQTKARDTLDELLFACHSWLSKNSFGEWEITVDDIGSSVLSLGDNDGYYNNCECLECSVAPSTNAIKTAFVQYDYEQKQITLSVNSGFGIDKTYSVPCVLEDTTAEKVLSYIYGRAIYADKKLQLSCDSEAASVLPGNIVTITIPDRSIAAVEYRVTGISKALNKYILDCEAYNSAIFDDQEIDAPIATDTIYSAHGLQVINSGTIGGMTITATLIKTDDGLVGLSSEVSGGTDWRIWAGHTTPGSAPFRVDEDGKMWATDAVIEGTITGSTIDIGGADATSFHVDVNGNMWLGAAVFADGPFRVNNAGEAWLENAHVEGIITAGELHIPDQDSTPNSFHTNTDGDSWWGCTETNFNNNYDNANAYILKSGYAKFQDVEFANLITLDHTNSECFIINFNNTDIDTELRFGRTTGGTASFTWNGSLVQCSKSFLPTELGINNISASEPETPFAKQVWLDVS